MLTDFVMAASLPPPPDSPSLSLQFAIVFYVVYGQTDAIGRRTHSLETNSATLNQARIQHHFFSVRAVWPFFPIRCPHLYSWHTHSQVPCVILYSPSICTLFSEKRTSSAAEHVTLGCFVSGGLDAGVVEGRRWRAVKGGSKWNRYSIPPL